MLVIDMKFLLELINLQENQSCIFLLKKRIKHLSIEISDENQLNNNNLETISNIFTNLRHIIIENKLLNNISMEKILLLFLNYFQKHNLISMIVRGTTTEALRNKPCQWLIDHTYLKKFNNKFQADCDENEFKIWL